MAERAPSERSLAVAAVEDEPRFRAGLKALLQTLPEVRAVTTYPSADPLLAAAERAVRLGDGPPWDLVLMDLGLPGLDGVEATRRTKALFPSLPVVALTAFEEPHSVLAAICAGADGYISKQASADELAEQLELTLRNGAALSPRLAGVVLKLIRLQGGGVEAAEATRSLGLSARQLEVLRALAEGRSYREIAQALGLSIDTVRTHIRRIYAALQVKSAAQAVSQALNRGLI